MKAYNIISFSTFIIIFITTLTMVLLGHGKETCPIWINIIFIIVVTNIVACVIINLVGTIKRL